MKISTKLKVSAPAQRAWKVLAEQFGTVAEWTTALESSALEGTLGVDAIRTCQSKAVGPFPAAKVKERLVEFDPELLRFAYEVQSGLPPIFKSAQNNWTIEAIDESSSEIHSQAILELNFWLKPFGWILAWLIKRDLKKVFEEMKYYIETGKIHPRKAKSNLATVKA